MAVINNIRFEKYAKFEINGENYTLIDYLSYLRTNAGITKKNISNIIKNNDYWYSQIETKKDHRTKFIRLHDLANIISVIQFGAKNESDLQLFFDNSIDYINNTFTNAKIKNDFKPHNTFDDSFATYNMDENFQSRLDLLNKSLKTIFERCTNSSQEYAIIQLLNEIIFNLNSNPLSSLHYMSLPFAAFLSGLDRNNNDQTEIKGIIKDFNSVLERYATVVTDQNMKYLLDKIKFQKIESKNLQYDFCLDFIDEEADPIFKDE